MNKAANSCQAAEAKLIALFRQPDDEAQCNVMLLTFAFARRDEVLAAGIQAMALTKRTDGPDEIAFDGFPILERLKEVCPLNERVWWARYLVLLLIRRDERLLTSMKALMQRRIAA